MKLANFQKVALKKVTNLKRSYSDIVHINYIHTHGDMIGWLSGLQLEKYSYSQ